MKSLSKYRAIKTTVDGIIFASKKEAGRYSELKLLERAGLIRDLRLQPVFPIVYNSVKICKYVGDFSYFEGNRFVVEDTKGFRTPVYRLKLRLMAAFYPGITVMEL